MPWIYEDEISVEKSPDYFENKTVPLLIHKWNPKIKLILIIRNPVIRAISTFSQFLERDKIKYDSNKYDEASKKIEKSILDSNGKVKLMNEDSLIKNGINILKNWLKYFPLKKMLILNGDELILNPFNVLIKVEAFLNLKSYFNKKQFIFN